MKTFLTTMIVLILSMFAHAQYFDMQRSLNINGESNPIRPEITNEFSYLGAAYTLGTEAGNLTGECGTYYVFRMYQSPSNEVADIWIDMTTYNKFDETIEQKTLKPDIGMRSTLGANLGFSMVITADKFRCYTSGTIAEVLPVVDSDVFDKLGGYVDYVAISGAGGEVRINGFQFGNGWIHTDGSLHLTNMATMRGYALNAGFEGNPSFSNGNFTFGSGNNSVTFTSKAVAWNAETGIGISGSFSTGGPLGLLGWNHLTFTFGSFERVPAAPVPEPATLVVLGVAVAGLPVVRRFRRG